MSELLKKIIWLLFSLALLVLIAAFAWQKGWLKTDFLAYAGLDSDNIRFPAFLHVQKKEKIKLNGLPFNEEDLSKLGQDGLSQVKILAQRAKTAGEKAQDFWSEAVRVDESQQQTVSDKAFEYGRYLYCQQIVEEYEQKTATPSATTPAP